MFYISILWHQNSHSTLCIYHRRWWSVMFCSITVLQQSRVYQYIFDMFAKWLHCSLELIQPTVIRIFKTSALQWVVFQYHFIHPSANSIITKLSGFHMSGVCLQICLNICRYCCFMSFLPWMIFPIFI